MFVHGAIGTLKKIWNRRLGKSDLNEPTIDVTLILLVGRKR